MDLKELATSPVNSVQVSVSVLFISAAALTLVGFNMPMEISNAEQTIETDLLILFFIIIILSVIHIILS